jgi:hypothetical protein
MKATLQVDGNSVPMKPFVETYLANICDAVLRSLKDTEGTMHALFRLEPEDLKLLVDGQPLDLFIDKGFAYALVRDTLRGVLTHFQGIPREWSEIRVELQRDR